MARIKFQEGDRYECVFSRLVGGGSEDAEKTWDARDPIEFGLMLVCTGLSDMLFQCSLEPELTLARCMKTSSHQENEISWWQLLKVLNRNGDFWDKNHQQQVLLILNWLKNNPQSILLLATER